MATSKASERVRGAGGKFISKEEAENITPESLPTLVHKSSKMTGALKDLQRLKEEEEFDKPLVSLSVNNPISWFMKWLNQLKKKQTTTFTFRLGVPLIALPVFITAFAAVFFGLGKITTPIKTEEVIVETPQTVYPMSRAGTLAKIGDLPEITYYLIVTSGEAIELVAPVNIDLSKLLYKRILATGSYASIVNVVTVDKEPIRK